ncbi:MAG: GNAT family N-acetyltransferase [Pseudomonadota bacterium]|nr:GNAT family N-acetyltransferase [Pseudomonadota bacterium]
MYDTAQLLFRRPTPADIEALDLLEQESLPDKAVRSFSNRNALNRWLADDGADMILAVIDKLIVGVILTTGDRDRQVIQTITVLPDAQRKHIGTRLVREAFAAAKTRGRKRLFVSYPDSRPDLKRFFASSGFETITATRGMIAAAAFPPPNQNDMKQPLIEAARHDDISHLIEIESICHNDIDHGIRLDAKNLADSIRAAGSHLLVARIDDSVSGYALLRRDGSYWVLDAIAVDPDYHRRGIGRQLVRHAEDIARKSDANEIAIHIEAGRPSHEAFVTALGYPSHSKAPERDYFGPGRHARSCIRSLNSANNKQDEQTTAPVNPIRSATHADIPSLVTLAGDMRIDFADLIDCKNTSVIIYDKGNDVTGFAALAPDTKTDQAFRLLGLAVGSDRRMTGIGRELMDAVYAIVRNAPGRRNLTLILDPANVGQRNFFRRNGIDPDHGKTLPGHFGPDRDGILCQKSFGFSLG